MKRRNLDRFQAACRLLAGVVVVLSMGACGGDSVVETCPGGTTGSPPNCVPIAEPCGQSVVVQQSVQVPSRFLIFDDFSVAEDGRLDVSLDWTNADSTMGFYLVPVGTCTVEEFNDRSCDFIIQGEPAQQKPRRLTQEVNAGNYRWLIGNFTDGVDESTSLQIVLSTGDCPPLAGVAPTASAHVAGLALLGARHR